MSFDKNFIAGCDGNHTEGQYQGDILVSVSYCDVDDSKIDRGIETELGMAISDAIEKVFESHALYSLQIAVSGHYEMNMEEQTT